MIQGKWFAPGADIADVLPVRNAVFGFAADPLDAESWNTVVYQDGVPAVAVRVHGLRDGHGHRIQLPAVGPV